MTKHEVSIMCMGITIGLFFGAILVNLTFDDYLDSKEIISIGCAEYDKQTGEFKLIDRSKK